MKKRKFNFKIIVHFGKGKDDTFYENNIKPIYEECKLRASKRESMVLYAEIFPNSKRGALVIKHKFVQMDTLGRFAVFKHGQRFPLTEYFS